MSQQYQPSARFSREDTVILNEDELPTFCSRLMLICVTKTGQETTQAEAMV